MTVKGSPRAHSCHDWAELQPANAIHRGTGGCSATSGVCACRGAHGDLRRVVCNVGTTGTPNGHAVTHRAVQGLFKEVGLTPNFVWDASYEVPEVLLPYDQKKALEDARLDNTVAQIKNAQQGAAPDRDSVR
jgi:hypothetical protein